MQQERNNAKEVCYDAFISYRHTEADMFVAKQLHREMEAFRLPRNVQKKRTDNKKTRINRVFRDRDELPLASNLEEPIRYALEASDFLIVICSPRLPESVWCKREIEIFMELKGRSRILAVLIEGEPEESFPELLRFAEIRQEQEDGSILTKRIPVEPLAADVRGKSRSEVKKKIKEEILRLAAPMFDCNYDDLKQRHREQRMKRILTIAGLGSAVCLLFGTISTSMAMKIQHQNQEISRQAEEITHQKQEIELQYQEAMVSNARLTATDALADLSRGDRVEAVKKARDVMPDSESHTGIPYVAEAEYALNQSLQVYANGNYLLPKFNMKHTSILRYMKTSPDREKLLTVDDSSIVTVWDIQTGEQMLRIEDYVQQSFIEETDITFLDNDRIACLAAKADDEFGNEIRVYDIVTGAVEAFDAGNAFYILGNGEGGMVQLGYHGLTFWKDGKEEATFPGDADYDNCYDRYQYNSDKSLLAVAQQSNKKELENRVIVIDTTSGEMVHCYPMDFCSFGEMFFLDEVLYVTNNQGVSDVKEEEKEIDYFTQTFDGKLVACNLLSYDEILWEYFSDDVSLKDAIPLGGKNSTLIANSYSGIWAINAADGTFIASYDFGEAVVEVGTNLNSDWALAYTKSGSMYSAHVTDGIMDVSTVSDSMDICNGGIKSIAFGKGNLLLLPYAGVDVTEMTYMEGTQLEKFAEVEATIYRPEINMQKDKIVYGSAWDEDVRVMNSESGALLYTIETGFDYGGDIGFTGQQDEVIAAISGEQVKLYATEDGTEVNAYILEDFLSSYSLEGANNEFLLGKGKEQCSIYDVLSGELLYEVTPDSPIGMQDLVALQPDGDRAAVTSAGNKKLSVYEVKNNQKIAEIPINASYATAIFFFPQIKEDGSAQLFVVYKDKSMEEYVISKDNQLTLQHCYDGFSSCPLSVCAGPDNRCLFIGEASGFLMQDGEMIAQIPDFCLVDWESKRFFTGRGKTLYRLPIYDYEMLLSEADAYLQSH